MSSTLFEAPAYDPGRERRRWKAIWTAIIIVLILAGLAYRYRNWPEERVADHFFAALQQKNYEQAYGIWMADPNWKQHPNQYAQYSYNEFYRDWGPGGDWGVVNNYKLLGSATLGSAGVVVVVDVNGRADKARVWIDKKNKSMSFSPA
jgi:hypothetical protein